MSRPSSVTARECANERRKATEEMLRSATTGLAAKGHPSTMYPPQWMPPPTLRKRMPKLIFTSSVILFVGLFAWGATLSALADNTQISVLLLTVAYPFVVISVALCFCSMYPLEHIENLNFRAIQVINLGALVNVLFGHGNFISTGVDETVGAFAGTTMLSVGTVMFTFCTFILGPWEFMAGSPLLSAGLLLRACATFVSLDKSRMSSDDLVVDLNIAACPFLFLALAFVLKKAYQLMRLPVLGSDNFRFFGVILYGGSIMANALLSIMQGIAGSDSMSDETFGFIVSITGSLAYLGTSVFLLDGSRVKHHCNAVLEDRYPSTMYLVRRKKGFFAANVSSLLALFSALASTVVHLNEDDNSVAGVTEFVTSTLIALSILILWFLAMKPSLGIALELKEKQIANMLYRSMAGLVIFAVGSASSGILTLISTIEHDNETADIHISIAAIRWSNAVALFGALLLVISNLPMETAPCKVSLLQPSTWENVYHPSNYVLLASIWLTIGSAFKIAMFCAFASLAYAWAFTVLLLHWNMAFYVWESMNLKESGEERVQEQLELDNEDDMFETTSVVESFDVLICGGGISGLFLACALGKAGTKVLLCEKRADSITDARFAVLNSASMEHMADVLDSDILEELESRALPESTHFGSMIVSGLGHPKARVIDAANSPSRRVLMENLETLDDWAESRTMGSKFASQLPLRIMQSHQEEVLKMQVARYQNVELYNGWLLSDFHINEDTGVRAKLIEVNEDEDGVQHPQNSNQRKEKLIHAKYIAGCDGPASMVAKKVQFRFDGLLNLAKTKSLLVHVPGLYDRVVHKLGNTHQYQIIRKNFGLAAIVAADPARDLWNVLFVFGDKPQTAPPEEVCRQFFGTDDFKVVQNRHWYWNFFIAREFRMKKRAFLVGDSAHSWPPFGGLGGNTSYGDVVNLSWKLALACKGRASDLLLESYGIERRQHVLQTAMYVLRATPNPQLMKILTSRIFYNPIYMPILRAGWYHHNSGIHGANHFAQSGIQLGVKLNFSPIIMREEVIPADDPSCEYTPAFRAGARLPYLPISTDGETTFSYIANSGYSIFVINTEALDIANCLAASISDRGVPQTVSIFPALIPSSYRGSRKKIAELLNLESVIVVRPDHIIAWRASDISAINPVIIDGAASKITGLDRNGKCLRNAYEVSDDAETTRCYHRWLTREFRYSQRPYKFRFPKSIPVENISKEAAIAIARAKAGNGNHFSTTTKQGGEKDEQTGANSLSQEGKQASLPNLSGFEQQVGPNTTPMHETLLLASEREARGEPVYNFAVGNPTLEPPVVIRESFVKLSQAALSNEQRGLFKYTNPGGLTQLRSHIANAVGQWQGTQNLCADNVIITPGAQSAIVSIFEALLQPGDHVLVQTPYYPAYEHAAELWGATTKKITFIEENFDMDLKNMEAHAERAGDKLRIIAICSPSNPTGKVVTSETIARMSHLVREHSQKYGRDVWLLVDHTYWRLSFSSNAVPATLPFYDQTILISSFSKDMSLAGERIGYIVVNPSAKKSGNLSTWLCNNNDKLGNISPPSMIQHVLVDVIEEHGELPNLADVYKERVEAMHKYLLLAGMKSCCKPDGTFYLFPRLPDGVDDRKFTQELVKHGVLVIPGTAFGAPGYIRLAALPAVDEIKIACEIIGHVLAGEEDQLQTAPSQDGTPKKEEGDAVSDMA